MLRKLRIVVSLVIFAGITFFFLDFADVLPRSYSLFARWQFIPAVFAHSAVIIVTLLALTFLFGRLYCSALCPLGTFQDLAIWISGRFSKKRKYGYRKPRTVLRYTILISSIVLIWMGGTALFGWLDPYSAYGRMATQLFRPVYIGANNLMGLGLSYFGNYSLYQVDMAVRSIASLAIALVTFFIIVWLSYRYGRLYCNTICPVGTCLGAFARFSLFKIRIDADKCNHCGACAKKCKASCIDSKGQSIDSSRCVDCFSCIGYCKQNALSFTYVRPSGKSEPLKTDLNKRAFFLVTVGGVLTASRTVAQSATAILPGSKAYKREQPIAPPGALSAEHLNRHCTACQLCVSKCPSKVLTPAWLEYGIEGVLQPVMNFDKGFCNFDCTVCGDVCPNKAIVPLSVEEKHLTQTGRVVFIEENCIVYTDATSCGACSEHCPTQAVSMQPYKDGLTIPVVNPDICVGCGGCEYVCPARPYRAIYIEGNKIQQQAHPIKEEEKLKLEIDDFGF